AREAFPPSCTPSARQRVSPSRERRERPLSVSFSYLLLLRTLGFIIPSSARSVNLSPAKCLKTPAERQGRDDDPIIISFREEKAGCLSFPLHMLRPRRRCACAPIF